MPEPSICCICLTKDRPEMLKRAVECFRAQTYERKRLYILDSGRVPATDSLPDNYPDFGIIYHRTLPSSRTIGALRNYANGFAAGDGCDILAHADDDDVSAPQRLAEQVALLQSGDYDAVGYRDILFWDTRKTEHVQRIADALGPSGREDRDEAWLYTHPNPNYAIGTSLLYHRRVWEQKPFAGLPQPGNVVGEDHVFQAELRVKAVSSLPSDTPPPEGCGIAGAWARGNDGPRMVASIHGGNTRKESYDVALRQGADEFKRAPAWDAYCASRMSVKI